MSTDSDVFADLDTALKELCQSGHQDLANQLARVLAVIVREAANRRTFAKALSAALVGTPLVAKESRTGPASNRRAPGVIDPFAIYGERGQSDLQEQLSVLTVDQLKDIISEHGMDRDKLAMKWQTPGRLIDRIVTTVTSRAHKGDVFLRTPGATSPALGSFANEMLRLAAEASPLAAVVACEQKVGDQLRTMLKQAGATSRGNMSELALQARERGLINDRTFEAVRGLGVMHTLALLGDGDVDLSKAREYIALTEGVLYALSSKH